MDRTRKCISVEEITSEWLNAYTASEDDKQCEVSLHEQKELCRRVPCRVVAGRWNLVYDYAKKFESRLKNKSTHKTLKLLAKAVNRYKNEIYSDIELEAQRKNEWPHRKKCVLMQLDYWSYEKQKALSTAEFEAMQVGKPFSPTSTNRLPYANKTKKTEQIESSTGNRKDKYSEVLHEFLNFNTESMNMSTQSINIDSTEEFENIIPNTDEFNLSISMTSTQDQQQI